MPATEKAFSLNDDDKKQLSNEKFGWEKNCLKWKMVGRSKAKTSKTKSYSEFRISFEQNEEMSFLLIFI